MRNYYVVVEIEEGMPDYNFVLKAKSLKEAEDEAYKIIKSDYPDYTQAHESFNCREISADDLLERLTL